MPFPVTVNGGGHGTRKLTKIKTNPVKRTAKTVRYTNSDDWYVYDRVGKRYICEAFTKPLAQRIAAALNTAA